jgi:hypothetical protein
MVRTYVRTRVVPGKCTGVRVPITLSQKRLEVSKYNMPIGKGTRVRTDTCIRVPEYTYT